LSILRQRGRAREQHAGAERDFQSPSIPHDGLR
jgi:hypothetical protein